MCRPLEDIPVIYISSDTLLGFRHPLDLPRKPWHKSQGHRNSSENAGITFPNRYMNLSEVITSWEDGKP